MRAWIARAAEAGRQVGERADLWPAGALAFLVYLGWLPLLVTVAPSVRTSQLVLFGAGLVSASLFPLNILLIAAGILALVLVACAAAALAEADLLDGLPTVGAGSPRPMVDRPSVFAVLVVALLPAAAAAGALVAGLAFIAPDALTSPDSGGSLPERLVTGLGPFIVVLVAALLVGQALGAAAIRRLPGAGRGLLAALGEGLLDILRRPARRLGIAFVATMLDLLSVVLAIQLLGNLWAPIGERMTSARFLSPETLLLLLGFIVVWLVTLAVMGAAHAWVSAWWSLELAPRSAEAVT